MGRLMDAKQLLEIVQNVKLWKGDVFTLATVVAETQKEIAANLADEAEQAELAQRIREA